MVTCVVLAACYHWIRRHFHLASGGRHKRCSEQLVAPRCAKTLREFEDAGVKFRSRGPPSVRSLTSRTRRAAASPHAQTTTTLGPPSTSAGMIQGTPTYSHTRPTTSVAAPANAHLPSVVMGSSAPTTHAHDISNATSATGAGAGTARISTTLPVAAHGAATPTSTFPAAAQSPDPVGAPHVASQPSLTRESHVSQEAPTSQPGGAHTTEASAQRLSVPSDAAAPVSTTVPVSQVRQATPSLHAVAQSTATPATVATDSSVVRVVSPQPPVDQSSDTTAKHPKRSQPVFGQPVSVPSRLLNVFQALPHRGALSIEHCSRLNRPQQALSLNSSSESVRDAVWTAVVHALMRGLYRSCGARIRVPATRSASFSLKRRKFRLSLSVSIAKLSCLCATIAVVS